MTTGFGFCSNCGTPRIAAEQKFCAGCGSTISAVAPPVSGPAAWTAPVPPAPEPEVAIVAPPAWSAPAEPEPVVPPAAPPAWSAPPAGAPTAPPPWATPPAVPGAPAYPGASAAQAAPPPPPYPPAYPGAPAAYMGSPTAPSISHPHRDGRGHQDHAQTAGRWCHRPGRDRRCLRLHEHELQAGQHYGLAVHLQLLGDHSSDKHHEAAFIAEGNRPAHLPARRRARCHEHGG